MTETKQPGGKLAQVTGHDVSIDPADHYDAWAETYEQDLLGEYGYRAHRIAAAAFTQELPERGAPIIDVGCGTGLVGVALRGSGYTAIDGVDISPKMLAQASKAGVYRELILQDAEKPSAIPDAAYGGVICAGSFGKGHLGPEAAQGLIRMARKGAPVVIFMNAEPYDDENYEECWRAMEREGRWRILRTEDHNYMDALERPGKLIVARRI